MTKANAIVTAGNVQFAQHLPFALMAGPCQMESRAHALDMAAALKEICTKLAIPLVYKSSFDKANRTSLSRHARHWPEGGTAGFRGNS